MLMDHGQHSQEGSRAEGQLADGHLVGQQVAGALRDLRPPLHLRCQDPCKVGLCFISNHSGRRVLPSQSSLGFDSRLAVGGRLMIEWVQVLSRSNACRLSKVPHGMPLNACQGTIQGTCGKGSQIAARQ